MKTSNGNGKTLKSLKPQLFLAKVNSLLFSSLFLLTPSCAKMTYVTEQGWGQLKIQWSGKDYEEVLKDPKVSEKIKEQIRKIQTYKTYFYKYFDKETTDIYSEVTFLDSDAVTHLVISSLYNKVEPHKEWFPFVGEFPYLGFFNKDSALEYAKDKETDQYYTYMRPVYAYSSLGNFEDKILSSFFQYKEEQLAELVFHEIFHTIFFVKSNVDLNENLASYFGREMMYEYFKIDRKQQSKRLEQINKFGDLRKTLVSLIESYKTELLKKSPKNKTETDAFLNDFLKVQFNPEIKKKCKVLGIKKESCYPLQGPWNNARFAAYMTYEKKAHFIEKLHKEKKFTLKQLFNYLEQKYNEYEDIDSKEKFGVWLEKQ